MEVVWFVIRRDTAFPERFSAVNKRFINTTNVKEKAV